MNDEIEVVCPSCSPKISVLHDVLKAGQNKIVQCQECGNVHPATLERTRAYDIKVIISKDDRSFTRRTRLTSEDIVRVDQEIIVDDEESDEVFPIIVTSMESEDKRVEKANAKDIRTIWGRAIDEVIVKIALHRGKTTEALEKRVPGGYGFVIGKEEVVDKVKVRIRKIKIRDGSLESRAGTAVEAKYIKRIFADEAERRGWGEGRTSWSMKGKGRTW